MPCASNDNANLGFGNGNDSRSNDEPGWELSHTTGVGSGCNDEKEEEEENNKEPEPDISTSSTPSLSTSTFGSCTVAAGGDSTSDDADEVDLVYDYEINTRDDNVDVESSVNTFEIELLKSIADQFDLTECEFGRRRNLRKGVRRKLTAGDTVGVGSFPSDELDSVHTCNDTTDSTGDCTAINGYMTAWVSTSSGRRHLSESDVYNAIEEFTNSYSNNAAGIRSVNYVGTRQANAPVIDKAISNGGEQADLVPASSGIGAGAAAGIGIAVIALLAILALITARIVKKRRDMKREAAEAREMSIVDNALFMIDEEEDMKEIRDDVSAAETEDYTLDGSIVQSRTFDSEAPSEDGFEVQL